VIENDDPPLETPRTLGFHQIAFVASRREQFALAVAGQHVEQIAGRPRMIAVDLDRQVGDHVAQLRAAFVKPREPLGECADRGVPRVTPDRRAVERPVRREAVDDRLDIAAVERRRVAHEQIADREPVFEIGEGHYVDPRHRK
jgi:hypothetical protein